jgi:hypothetical protein
MIPLFRCSRIILALVAFPAGALGDEYATTSSGRRVLLRDNGTWVEASPAPKAEQGGFLDAEKVLKEKCVSEWPTDFSMQAYCQRQQREAVQDLARGKPQDIPENQFSIVRSKCSAEWPTDFSMRAYCERQQFEAIRKLGH